MIATMISMESLYKDMYPQPGERVKRWVVDMRRERAWERETCPRFEVPVHEDNTGASCRNGGATVPWTYLDHDCCYACGDLHETYRMLDRVIAWLAEKAARPPICDDRTELSDEIAEDLALREHPMLAKVGR